MSLGATRLFAFSLEVAAAELASLALALASGLLQLLAQVLNLLLQLGNLKIALLTTGGGRRQKRLDDTALGARAENSRSVCHRGAFTVYERSQERRAPR